MSLETEISRVVGGAKETLKTLITKMGGTVGDELIDQYPALADKATKPDKWDKGVLLDGGALKDVNGKDIHADVKAALDIPAANDAKLTIQKNGAEVGTFSANASADKTVNITVPTKASEVGAVPTSRTVNGKALSANITLAASDVGALPSNTHIPSTVAEMSDAGNYALKSDKVSKSGDTMTGKLTVPQVETGDGNSNFFQCRKFRGEGDANTYYHAIDFGHKNHDQVDFHEYGGKWNFYKNQSGKVNEGVLCGSITSNGWEGRAKLKSGSTMVTSQLTENSDAIATTAFVHGLVDMGKAVSFTVTLTAAGWSGNAQTVSNSKFITSGYAYTVCPAGDSFAGYTEAVIYADDVTTAGKMTFHCNEAPTENLTVNILRTEVTA